MDNFCLLDGPGEVPSSENKSIKQLCIYKYIIYECKLSIHIIILSLLIEMLLAWS